MRLVELSTNLEAERGADAQNLAASQQVTGTTVTTLAVRMGVWNNSADEITRIDVVSSQTNGIGIGSRLEIWGTAAI